MKCDCCGSKKKVETQVSTLAHLSIELCEYCRINRHEPKWVIDAVADDEGGMEHCPTWLQNKLMKARYCLQKSEDI